MTVTGAVTWQMREVAEQLLGYRGYRLFPIGGSEQACAFQQRRTRAAASISIQRIEVTEVTRVTIRKNAAFKGNRPDNTPVTCSRKEPMELTLWTN